MSSSHKDAPMASKKDRRCKDCKTLVAAAYPHLDLDTVLMKMSDSGFAHAYEQALEVFLGLKRGKFLKEEFTEGFALEVTVSAQYVLMPESFLETLHGSSKAKELGLTLDTISNEHGIEERGFLIQIDEDLPSESKNWKRVTVSSRKSHIHNTYLMHTSEQVRKEQGKDVAVWYSRDAIKSRGPGFKAPWRYAALRDTIAAKQKEKADKAQAEVAEPQAPTAVKQEQEDDDEESSAMASEDEPLIRLQSAKAKQKVGKQVGNKKDGRKRPKAGKDASEGGAKKRFRICGKGAMASSLPPMARTAPFAAPSDGGLPSGACSVRTPGSQNTRIAKTFKTASPTAKMCFDVEKHIEAIDITEIVSGKNLGNSIQFAKRSLTSWAKDTTNSFMDSAEVVSLKAHLELAERAYKLSPACIEALPDQERKKLLEIVMVNVDADRLSKEFQLALLLAELKTMDLKNAEKIRAYVQKIVPLGGRSATAFLTLRSFGIQTTRNKKAAPSAFR